MRRRFLSAFFWLRIELLARRFDLVEIVGRPNPNAAESGAETKAEFCQFNSTFGGTTG